MTPALRLSQRNRSPRSARSCLQRAWPATVHALGTAAGTNITGTATVDYSIGGTPAMATSNTSTVAVAEIVNVTIALQSPTVAVAAGATQRSVAVSHR